MCKQLLQKIEKHSSANDTFYNVSYNGQCYDDTCCDGMDRKLKVKVNLKNTIFKVKALQKLTSLPAFHLPFTVVPLKSILDKLSLLTI